MHTKLHKNIPYILIVSFMNIDKRIDDNQFGYFVLDIVRV